MQLTLDTREKNPLYPGAVTLDEIEGRNIILVVDFRSDAIMELALVSSWSFNSDCEMEGDKIHYYVDIIADDHDGESWELDTLGICQTLDPHNPFWKGGVFSVIKTPENVQQLHDFFAEQRARVLQNKLIELYGHMLTAQ